MSREVRRVPADWQHPVRPGLEMSHGYRTWQPRWVPLYGDDMDAAIGERDRTHWQMYETTSEGTPLSPVMATPEDLARWLASNGTSVFGSRTATYDQWLAMILGSGATVGAVIKHGQILPGWLDGQEDAR